METLLVSESDMNEILRAVGRDELMDRIIKRLGEGLAETGRGRLSHTPARGGFEKAGSPAGVLEWMPHHEPGDSVTIKTVAYTPDNPDRFGLPTIIGTMARFDEASGRLLALSDAVLPTALRTGAASAIASRILARPDSETVGLIGAGAQAVTQLHAISRVFPIRRALVWDVDVDRAAEFAERVAFLGIDVKVAPPEDIIRAADIISTVTSVEVGAGPVLPDLGAKEHLHINAVGSDLVGKTELPLSLVRRAFLCPDHPEQARAEGEAQQIPDLPLGPRLTELCADPGAFADQRNTLTVFDSTGYALEDHLTLDVVLETATELGLGTRMRIEYHPAAAVDPYSGALHPAAPAVSTGTAG